MQCKISKHLGGGETEGERLGGARMWTQREKEKEEKKGKIQFYVGERPMLGKSCVASQDTKT